MKIIKGQISDKKSSPLLLKIEKCIVILILSGIQICFLDNVAYVKR